MVYFVTHNNRCLTELLCVVLVVFWFVVFLPVKSFSLALSTRAGVFPTMSETSGAVFNCTNSSFRKLLMVTPQVSGISLMSDDVSR